MASHLDMQKIGTIRFFFENGLHWQLEVGTKFLQMAVLGYLFIYIQIKIFWHNSSYVEDKWDKNLSHKKWSTIMVRKCSPERPS